MLFKVGSAAVVALLISGAAQAQSTAPFNVTFDGSVGASTPLSITSGNNTLTFNSPSGPGTFTVENTGLFSTLGNALGDYGSFSGDPLTITFANPVTTPVSLSFGIEDAFGPISSDILSLTTNLGYSTSAPATVSGGTLGEPQGLATVYNPGFTTLTITSANPYAIGNVTSVPEPFTLSIMAVGLAGVAVARRRRG